MQAGHDAPSHENSGLLSHDNFPMMREGVGVGPPKFPNSVSK